MNGIWRPVFAVLSIGQSKVVVEAAARAMRHLRPLPITLVTVVLAAMGLGGAYYLGAGQEEAIVRGKPPEDDLSDVTPALEPSPSLDPEEVVMYQMAVLRHSGGGDAGIRQCYTFASPLNRAATGPLDRFAQMVRSPPYQVMLQAADVLVGRAIFQEDQGTEWAAVLVTLVDRRQRIRVFRFYLSKQRESPYEGCWMTDAVQEMVLQSPSAPAVGV